MKKLNLAAVLTLALGFTMNAQLIFNTGQEPSGGYRAYGLQDAVWFVAQTPMNSVATPPASPAAYVRAVTQDASGSGWWNPHVPGPTFSDAGWITYPNTCQPAFPAYHGCLNDPVVQWRVDQWYKISFYLCCDVTDFCLPLDMWADNRIQEVYVNTMTNSGTGYWQNTAPIAPYLTNGDYEGYHYGAGFSQTFCNFRQGLNYMIIRVVSGDPYSNSDWAGLLVHTQRTTCTGITMNILELDEEGGDGHRKAATSSKKVETTKAISTKEAIALNQNVPNPYDGSTVISYTTPEKFGKAQIVFTAADGRIVKTVDITEKGPGKLTISASDLGTGLYSYSLIIDGSTIESKKMIKQ